MIADSGRCAFFVFGIPDNGGSGSGSSFISNYVTFNELSSDITSYLVGTNLSSTG